MRTIIINKNQEELIKEELSHINNVASLPVHIIDAINNHKTPLSNLNIPDHINKRVIEKMFVDSFNEAKNNFSDDITSFDKNRITNKLDKLTAICQKKERQIKKELEKLCSDVVTSIFNSNGLDNITLTCNLIDEIPIDKQFHVDSDYGYEYDDMNDITSEGAEIEHRVIENAIVVGGALRIYDMLQNILVSELFKLDEDLPHLYSKIIKINNYLNFIDSTEITDKNHMQSGYVDVTITGDELDKIESYGTLFPFMVIETIRGFIELIASKNLPDNNDKFDNIIDKSDLLKYEPWYMMIGPQIWDKIISSDIDAEYITPIASTLFNLDTVHFNNFIYELICNTKTGKTELDKLIKYSMYNKEYSSFEKDLENRRKEHELIIDGKN